MGGCIIYFSKRKYLAFLYTQLRYWQIVWESICIITSEFTTSSQMSYCEEAFRQGGHKLAQSRVIYGICQVSCYILVARWTRVGWKLLKPFVVPCPEYTEPLFLTNWKPLHFSWMVWPIYVLLKSSFYITIVTIAHVVSTIKE